ncbi:hypothetical protein KM043_006249 [Ampulex compressa]|nr:hypothetical protein KM043_006249 [Ampulex compressa]
MAKAERARRRPRKILRKGETKRANDRAQWNGPEKANRRDKESICEEGRKRREHRRARSVVRENGGKKEGWRDGGKSGKESKREHRRVRGSVDEGRERRKGRGQGRSGHRWGD